MRNSATLPKACFWLLILLSFVFRIEAAQSPASAQEAAVIPKSLFIDDVTVGKDPFFPRSTRRGPQIKEVVAAAIETTPDLLLKGVSGTSTRRLAIINNRTFEVGEEGEIRIKGQSVRVKCMEIKDKSVQVKINGVDRELLLAPR
jgi:hypothetical protein